MRGKKQPLAFEIEPPAKSFTTCKNSAHSASNHPILHMGIELFNKEDKEKTPTKSYVRIMSYSKTKLQVPENLSYAER